MKAMFIILALAYLQNVSFSVVSRSRNRSSYTYHLLASIFSNSVFFLTFRQLVLSEMNWLLFLPYTIGTVAGSLSGVKVSMWIERRIGAGSDSHLDVARNKYKEAGWLWKLLTGQPHLIIGPIDRPHMHRRFLLPRNSWMNLYLHEFFRDDDDRALHDHPWWFVSLMLSRGYREVLDGGIVADRGRFSIVFRWAEHRHRVVLLREKSGLIKPCWTIVLTGPKFRTWGFWCPQGFVPWHEFRSHVNPGQIGRGCG